VVDGSRILDALLAWHAHIIRREDGGAI